MVLPLGLLVVLPWVLPLVVVLLWVLLLVVVLLWVLLLVVVLLWVLLLLVVLLWVLLLVALLVLLVLVLGDKLLLRLLLQQGLLFTFLSSRRRSRLRRQGGAVDESLLCSSRRQPCSCCGCCGGSHLQIIAGLSWRQLSAVRGCGRRCSTHLGPTGPRLLALLPLLLLLPRLLLLLPRLGCCWNHPWLPLRQAWR